MKLTGIYHTYHKKIREYRKKHHICTECAHPIDNLSFTRCSTCRSKEKIERARLKILGICRNCSKRKVKKGKEQCGRCAIAGRLNRLNLSPKEKASALIALGYKQHEARRFLMKHQDKNLPSEELVRLALKEIE